MQVNVKRAKRKKKQKKNKVIKRVTVPSEEAVG